MIMIMIMGTGAEGWKGGLYERWFFARCLLFGVAFFFSLFTVKDTLRCNVGIKLSGLLSATVIDM